MEKQGVVGKSVAVMIVGVAALAASLTVAGTSRAEGVLQEFDLSASMSVDFYSRYLWRGFTLDSDPVVQPGFSVSGYGLTVSYWGSHDLDNNDALASAETDFVIDYSFDVSDGVGMSLGHTYYDFPGGNTYSKEWYAGVSFGEIPLSPSLTYYYDYGDENTGGGDGQYLLAAIGQSFTLSEAQAITLDLAASVGFNHELFIKGDGGDIGVSAGLGIPLTANLSCSPKIGYAIPFGDLKDSADGNQKTRFYSGVSLSASF